MGRKIGGWAEGAHHAASACVDEAQDLVFAGGGVGAALVIPLDVLDQGLVHGAMHQLLPVCNVPKLYLERVGGWVDEKEPGDEKEVL